MPTWACWFDSSPGHIRCMQALRLTRMAMARHLLMVLALAASPLASAQVPWPGASWPIAAPAAQGMSPAPLDSLDAAITAGRYGNVDRMVVVKNGYLVYSQRYDRDYQSISEGYQGALGCGYNTCEEGQEDDAYNYYSPRVHPYYQGREVHTLQSVTKSVAATVVGAALTNGEIDSLGAPLLSFFSAYDTQDADPRLHEATLADLLTMRTGIEWHEQDRPLDETNTTLQLEHSDDWIQFTLDQPMDAAPGEKWVYNSGGSHLMSGVVLDATGMTIDAYAEQHVFGPLQIEDYHWKRTPRGLPDTEGGLYLEAAQLAKIGYLYLHRGQWNGQRILRASFVEEAIGHQVERVNRSGWGYGYQWWRLDRDGVAVWAGLGFGGQYLLVLPDHALIGVINSWNIFGQRVQNVLPAFLDTLLKAAQ